MKIIEWIKRNWASIMLLLGLAAGTAIVIEEVNKKPLLPEIDVKKEKAKAKTEANIAISKIDSEAKAKEEALTNMSTQEALAILDSGTTMKIDQIKDNAVANAVDNIMEQVKELQNGKG
jgi:thiamine biosynthesis protein ThiC